jgi:hypothetical protein
MTSTEFVETEVVVSLSGLVAERIACREFSRAYRRSCSRFGAPKLKALHEAAHTVISSALGLHPRIVTIVSDASRMVGNGYRGGYSQSSYQPPSSDAPPAQEPPSSEPSQTDTQYVVALLRLAGQYHLERLREYRLRTEALLVEHWPEVERLAKLLWERKTLGRPEILAILEGR